MSQLVRQCGDPISNNLWLGQSTSQWSLSTQPHNFAKRDLAQSEYSVHALPVAQTCARGLTSACIPQLTWCLVHSMRLGPFQPRSESTTLPVTPVCSTNLVTLDVRSACSRLAVIAIWSPGHWSRVRPMSQVGMCGNFFATCQRAAGN